MTITSTAPTRSGRRTPAQPSSRPSVPFWVPVALASVAVVLLRLPFLTSPLAPDEAGFLAVAAQWHPGGTSLYGNYWVDRPPLLLMLFQLAAALGGTVALRAIGMVAAVVTVVAVSHAAHRLVGARGAVVAAVVAAAWMIDPLAGSMEVDGELLAAPFLALGLGGVITALTTCSRRRAMAGSFVAGLSGVAAVLVKQNMLDVLVFAAVAVVLVRFTAAGRASSGRGPVLAGMLAGGTVAALAVGWWTVAHGTSLGGVWFAMYPFRADARAVLAAYPSSAAPGRLLSLAGGAVGSGLLAALLLSVAMLPRLARTRHARGGGARWVTGLALAVVLAYDVVSMFLGGGYWIHYLVQPVAAAAIAVGLATAVWPLASRVLAGLAVGAALIAAGVAAGHPVDGGDAAVGAAVGEAARPSDSIVTVWGHAGVTQASGLRSPYPHLWSLPTRTLDPRLTLLTSVLKGDDAPTWVVSGSGADPQLAGVPTDAFHRALDHRYHEVADLNGDVVYLRNGVRRETPQLGSSVATTTFPHQESS